MNEFENSLEWKSQLKAENGQPPSVEGIVSAYQALYQTLEQPLSVTPPPDLAETIVNHLSRIESRERWSTIGRCTSLVAMGVTGALFSLPTIYVSATAANETLAKLPWFLVVFVMTAMLLANAAVLIQTDNNKPENM